MQKYLVLCSLVVFQILNAMSFPDAVAQPPVPVDLSLVAEQTLVSTHVGQGAEAWTSQLEKILSESELPALWAGKFYRDGRSVMAAAGVRKIGEDRPVAVDDKIHLGSCTKAMTAMLVAQAVTKGKLRWDSTLGEIFNDHAGLQNSEWRHVTLMQLVQHRSGAPANGLWQSLHDQYPEDVIASRRALLDWLVKKKRPAKSTFSYSNAGYALLGHVLEHIEQQSWESIIEEQLFAPLGITSAGFGPVVGDAALDQPWGHVEPETFSAALGRVLKAANGASIVTSREDLKPIRIDNPPPLGPAGRVHMSLGDWAKFVQLFATTDAPAANLGVDPPNWNKLFDVGDGSYGGGWNVAERDWGGGKVLNHAGSNTTWFCIAWVAPQKDFFVLVASNSFTAETPKVCDRVASELIGLEIEKVGK